MPGRPQNDLNILVISLWQKHFMKNYVSINDSHNPRIAYFLQSFALFNFYNNFIQIFCWYLNDKKAFKIAWLWNKVKIETLPFKLRLAINMPHFKQIWKNWYPKCMFEGICFGEIWYREKSQKPILSMRKAYMGSGSFCYSWVSAQWWPRHWQLTNMIMRKVFLQALAYSILKISKWPYIHKLTP